MAGTAEPLAVGLTALAAGTHLVLWGADAPWGRAELAGTALLAAGLAWIVWAAAALRVAGTPIGSGSAARVLVEEGPYRLGRHPIYLGTVVAMAGAALALGMPLLVLAALAFAAIVATVHVPREEAALQRHFGGWYRDYAADVRRWL
jgi:protein-S-isoprenylcysteine O-methyltransferase Ste14